MSESYFKVRFGDTDPWGVAYFVSYFRYANQAVEDYLCRLLGKPEAKVWRDAEEGYGLPVVEAKGRFLKPVKHGDRLEASVEMRDKGDKGVLFLCRFVKEAQVVAEVELTCVAIDPDWRPRVLPERLKGGLGDV